MPNEAVITGVGAITPLGSSVEETWRGLKAGESGITEITRFDPRGANCKSRIAGEVEFSPEEYDAVQEDRMGRYAQLAVATSLEAVADAEIHPDEEAWEPRRVGTSVASAFGGLPEIEDGVKADRLSARYTVNTLPNLAAGYVSQKLAAEGPIYAPSTACAAGTHAVGQALEEIRADRADVMIAGGAEAVLNPTNVRGYDAMRALSRRNDEPDAASRPFDADRDGFVTAEGAGVMVLESLDHAADRGADPIARVTGYAQRANAHHPAQPPTDGHGLRRSMQNAIRDAGRSPAEVDHVNAHATSTPRGDKHEATAIRSVFDEPPVTTSIKSMIGHPAGASGAIEAVIAAKTLEDDVVPPTINYETPDPECDIEVSTTALETDVEVVVSNSAGFGGANGTVVFETA